MHTAASFLFGTLQPSCPASSVQTKRCQGSDRILCQDTRRAERLRMEEEQEFVGQGRGPLAKYLDRGRAPFVAAAQLSHARRNEILNLDQPFREMNGSIVGNISVLCLQTTVGSIT